MPSLRTTAIEALLSGPIAADMRWSPRSFEAELDHSPCSISGVTLAASVGANGVAELGSLDAGEREAGEADQLVALAGHG
jgi:hypothetical protein